MAQTYQEINAYREKNERFFDENINAPGVEVLPSGVQYKVITRTNGPRPTGKSKVTVH